MSAETNKKRGFSRADLKRLLGIFQYVLPYKGAFFTGLIFLFLSSGMFLAFPFVSGKLIDIASGKEGWITNNIDQAALILIAVLLLQSLISFFRVILFANVTERAIGQMRTDLYANVISLPMTFFDKNRIGELVSRISNDISILESTISTTLAELIRQTVILITGVVLIFYTAPSLSVFMLLIFPVVILSAVLFGRFIRNLSKRKQDMLANSNIIVEETLHSVATIKAFTSEFLEIVKYQKTISQVVKTALKVARFRAAFIAFVIFALFGAIVAIMWYGSTLVQNGEMTVGELLSFVLYTTFIGASIAGLGDLIGQIQKSVGASERVLELLGETKEDLHAALESERIEGPIIFEEVSFSYPTRPETEVLQQLNLIVKPGEKLALVGHSGAGKSTIAQLILRLYQPTSGQIRFGATNANHIHLNLIRKNIAIVPQEVILFGVSIMENIRYGKPGATDEEVISAAEKANALEFIQAFPDSFGTTVGERGVKLSGGQRQRIAIARALLKDPAILILDEATSSLDSESEHLVQQALNQLMVGRTTIIIAHRLATVKDMDKIYLLEKGQIVEEGTHQSLLVESQRYRNFVELQRVSDEVSLS